MQSFTDHLIETTQLSKIHTMPSNNKRDNDIWYKRPSLTRPFSLRKTNLVKLQQRGPDAQSHWKQTWHLTDCNQPPPHMNPITSVTTNQFTERHIHLLLHETWPSRQGLTLHQRVDKHLANQLPLFNETLYIYKKKESRRATHLRVIKLLPKSWKIVLYIYKCVAQTGVAILTAIRAAIPK